MIEMSTDYTQTLRSIKDAEEASSKAIDEKKKMLTERLENARSETVAEVASVKEQAETMVTKEIDIAQKSAEADSKKIVESTVSEAQAIARKKVTKSALKKIIEETLLSEFAGE